MPPTRSSDAATSPWWAARWLAVVFPLLATFLALGLWITLSPADTMHVLREGGPIEGLTEKMYFFLAIALWFSPRKPDEWRVTLALTVLLVAAGAREMDLHKALTGYSVLKVSFYLQNHPLLTKLVAFVCVASTAAAAIYVLRNRMRSLWQGMRRGEPMACSIAVLVITLVITKLMDRSISVLGQDFGLHASASTVALVSALEETVEMSLPMIASWARLQYMKLATCRSRLHKKPPVRA